MPMLCAMSVLAALSALPLLGPGWALMPTLSRESISMGLGAAATLVMWKERCQASPPALAQVWGTGLAPPDLTPGTLGEVALCWGSAWNLAWHSEGCAGTTAPVGVQSR